MNIQFIVKPGTGCDYHRLVLPMEYIGRHQADASDNITMHLIDSSAAYGEADIVLYNRLLQGRANYLNDARKKFGCKIVVDLDDFWELFPSHPMYNRWAAKGISQQIAQHVKQADLVICTNEQLRKEILQLNKNVVIVPNAIPFGERQFTQGVKEASDKTRFIYAGGSSHLDDVKLLTDKFSWIKSFLPIRKRSEFILAGGYANPEPQSVWHQMGEVFKSTGAAKFVDGLPLNKYMTVYDNADVALVPLVDNRFNHSKSILKVLEAATKGLPCIVSAVWPYLELKDFPGILWVNHPSDWLKHIRFCIDNPSWVAEQGAALRAAVVEKYNLFDWNNSRYQILKHLSNK